MLSLMVLTNTKLSYLFRYCFRNYDVCCDPKCLGVCNISACQKNKFRKTEDGCDVYYLVFYFIQLRS